MSIRVDVGGEQSAKSKLVEVAKGVFSIAEAEKKAEQAARARGKAQQEANRHTERAAKGGGPSMVGKSLQQLGRIGGQVGGDFGRLAGSFNAPTATLVALGAGAAVAGVALKALAAASERAAQAAMAEAKIRQDVKESIKTAVKAADQHAVSTVTSNRDALSTLAGVGGDKLVARAQSYASAVGPGGLEAFAELAKAGKLTDDNIKAVTLASRTGQVSLGQAASAVTSGNVRLAGGAQNVAAGIVSNVTDRSTSAADVERMRASFMGSRIGSELGRYDSVQGDIQGAGVNRFVTGVGVTAAREQYSRLTDPERAGRNDVGEVMERQLEVLREGSRAEWAVWAAIKDLGSYIGVSDGSYGSQSNRLSRAASAAGAVY